MLKTKFKDTICLICGMNLYPSIFSNKKLVEVGIYGTKNQIKQSRATKYALNNIDTVLSRTTNENVLWIVIYDCGQKEFIRLG